MTAVSERKLENTTRAGPAREDEFSAKIEEKDDKFLMYMFVGTILYLIVLLFVDALMSFVR